jgi:hypothetical protein
MAIYFQYWIGAGALTAFAMITPIWLIFDDKPLEAALVVISTVAGSIAMTIGMLRKE